MSDQEEKTDPTELPGEALDQVSGGLNYKITTVYVNSVHLPPDDPPPPPPSGVGAT